MNSPKIGLRCERSVVWRQKRGKECNYDTKWSGRVGIRPVRAGRVRVSFCCSLITSLPQNKNQKPGFGTVTYNTS